VKLCRLFHPLRHEENHLYKSEVDEISVYESEQDMEEIKIYRVIGIPKARA